MSEFGNKVNEMVSVMENAIFGSGPFSEGSMRSDLQFRREKRDFYVSEYIQWEDYANQIKARILEHQAWDQDMIRRCDNCSNESRRLLNIVYTL